ncbi:MAG: thioredoxin-dependent thiol peroxidase [Flavobacteriaceae bacterium]|jgi:peroxiredoxin Q/BCP
MKPLNVGDKVPFFSVTDNTGKKHTLKDYQGKKVVFFFYPKANTPGCTAEACDLRDHYTELQNAGFTLLGVSADNEKAQQNFVSKFDFPFPLLADTEKKVINAFGVWGPKKFMGKEYNGIHRMTFIVDEMGVVERVISKVETKNHAAQILNG